MLLTLLLTVAIHGLVGVFGQTGAPGVSLGRPLRRPRRSEIDRVTPPLRPKPVRESVRLGVGYHSQVYTRWGRSQGYLKSTDPGLSTGGGQGGKDQGGTGPSDFQSHKQKFVFNKRTIKVCVSCS